MKFILLIGLCLVVNCLAFSIPRLNNQLNVINGAAAVNYTLFKQCDSAWGSHALGTSATNTICSAGCAMSSLAMVLNTFKEKVEADLINPLTLNNWLVSHSGYVYDDDLVWASADSLGIVKFSDYYRGAGSLSLADLQKAVDGGRPVIVNVRASTHWVLVFGYSGSTFFVNDPGFSTTSYVYSGMSNFIVYIV